MKEEKYLCPITKEYSKRHLLFTKEDELIEYTKPELFDHLRSLHKEELFAFMIIKMLDLEKRIDNLQ